MKKLLLFTVFFLGLLMGVNAQVTTIFYQSNNNVANSKDNAKFYIVYKPINKGLVAYQKFSIDNILIENGQVQSIGTQIKEGTITSFYSNGNLKDVINFEAGLPSGEKTHYFNNGKINYTIRQISAGYGKNNTKNSSTNYFYCTNPNGEVLLINGNGNFEEYDANQQLIKKGTVKNTLPDGLWQGYDNDKITFFEEYNNGFLIKGENVDASGRIVIYTSSDNRPEPKGGINNFYAYVASSMQDKAMLQDNDLQGKLTLRFVIEATGEIKDVKVVTPSTNLQLNNLAVEVIKQAPKWEPATQQGEAVDMTFFMPIAMQ